MSGLRTRVWGSLVAAAAILAASVVAAPPAAADPVNVYTTSGQHTVNGRQWRTECSTYSSTVHRCRTEIMADTVIKSGSTFRASKGWVFTPAHDLGRWPDSAALDSPDGVSMIAGHVWVGQAPGVLADLHHVAPGKLVAVVDADGTRTEYLVSAVAEYPREDLPAAAWGSTTGERGLVLVTCAGRATEFDGRRVWSKNLVVEAVPIQGSA